VAPGAVGIAFRSCQPPVKKNNVEVQRPPQQTIKAAIGIITAISQTDNRAHVMVVKEGGGCQGSPRLSRRVAACAIGEPAAKAMRALQQIWMKATEARLQVL
jgi:hypothetical protein